MRTYKKKNSFSVTAISGTYVVMLGFNLPKSQTKNLLGFAIHRTDHTENENYPLKGFKVFKETEPNPIPGKLYSTFEHPVQSFQWADYTAKPEHKYTYKIVPLTGTPKNMRQLPSMNITIKTEPEDFEEHAIYFNRGVAGSQAYNKYSSRKPEEWPDRRAFIWLSRGLEEAILKLIDRANSSDYGLRASVYEFNYQPVLEAFKKAAHAGADVKIVYDSRQDNPRIPNDEAIELTEIRDLMIRRTQPKSYISHNKFIVLLKNGKPIEVWTGSTNFTKGGIFGQANVGHLIRNEKVAKKYYDYWLQLSTDPTNPNLKKWIEKETPDLADKACECNTITPLFSPRKSLNFLDWCANRMDEGLESVCLTAAFGVNSKLAEILAKDKSYLRYVLLEKEANNFNVISQDPDVIISVGSHLDEPIYRWTKEILTDYNFHVRYIHTKFMLIDALSENPTVITGSANFSDNSTTANDENTLVIQGNKRVADIYLGEFFRIFNHFYFRYIVKKQKKPVGTKEKDSSYLKPDDSWTKKYYIPGAIKEKQRIAFSRKLS